MVVLKTPSQLNSFIKRMQRKHNRWHREGCGCCGTDITVVRSGNRVILREEFMVHGDMNITVNVLAIIKGRAR